MSDRKKYVDDEHACGKCWYCKEGSPCFCLEPLLVPGEPVHARTVVPKPPSHPPKRGKGKPSKGGGASQSASAGAQTGLGGKNRELEKLAASRRPSVDERYSHLDTTGYGEYWHESPPLLDYIGYPARNIRWCWGSVFRRDCKHHYDKYGCMFAHPDDFWLPWGEAAPDLASAYAPPSHGPTIRPPTPPGSFREARTSRSVEESIREHYVPEESKAASSDERMTEESFAPPQPSASDAVFITHSEETATRAVKRLKSMDELSRVRLALDARAKEISEIVAAAQPPSSSE